MTLKSRHERRFCDYIQTSFQLRALQVRVDCSGLRSTYPPEYYPRILVNLGAWIDLYAITATSELTVKPGWCLSL